ncbi:MAG TPA: SIS domain-containing protein, partial [Thermoleophilia bacterium]|nr:SIS domain-containing protein [Thermoleophilia bacterium]
MTAMRDEIREQPAVVERLAAQRERFAAAADEARASGARFVLYAARGTSDNAAVYGKYLATILAGLPAGLAVPSAVTLYSAAIDLRDCLVFGISQSGETPDVAEYVAAATRAGAFTVAVTNREESPLAEAARVVLPTGAGVERAVAATKTYTSQLAALAMFWAAWTGRADILDQLAGPVPEAMAAALDGEAAVAGVADRLVAAERLIVTGRGYNYATALETALKVTETCRMAALSYSAADLMHGPVAMVGEDSPVLIFAPAGRAQAGMLALERELRGRGAQTMLVTEGGTPSAGPAAAIGLPRVETE